MIIIIIITRPPSPLATSFPRHRVDEPRQWCRRRGLDGLGMSIDCLVWRLWGDCAPVPALIYRHLEIQRCVLHPNFRTPNRERGPVTIIRLHTQVKILSSFLVRGIKRKSITITKIKTIYVAPCQKFRMTYKKNLCLPTTVTIG